eukprot:5404338-Pleurochrysis_carterae.AAC.3
MTRTSMCVSNYCSDQRFRSATFRRVQVVSTFSARAARRVRKCNFTQPPCSELDDSNKKLPLRHRKLTGEVEQASCLTPEQVHFTYEAKCTTGNKAMHCFEICRALCAKATPMCDGNKHHEKYPIVEAEEEQAEGVTKGLDGGELVAEEDGGEEDEPRVARRAEQLEHHGARPLDHEERGDVHREAEQHRQTEEAAVGRHEREGVLAQCARQLEHRGQAEHPKGADCTQQQRAISARVGAEDALFTTHSGARIGENRI